MESCRWLSVRDCYTFARSFFDCRTSRIYQPAIGGLIIGIILIFFPQVLGVGYEYVDQALNNQLLLKTMVVLCVMKLVATIVSYASGNAGGIFSPSLYLGAMAGGAVGILVHRFAPFPVADSGAYALVGMGTTFAGIVRAPMTSVFMIFELTQDYQILVPLMIANMISLAISKRFQPVAFVPRVAESGSCISAGRQDADAGSLARTRHHGSQHHLHFSGTVGGGSFEDSRRN